MLVYLRRAVLSDLPEILEIISHAKSVLAEKKIPQWQNGYGPSKQQLIQDITKEQCYVLLNDYHIIGLGVVSTTKEQAYEQLTSGNWQQTRGAYNVIHRVALAPEFQGKGFAALLMTTLITAARLNNCLDIRIDTHPKNTAMQHLIKKIGFIYRGELLLAIPNGERFAYQLILS